MTHKHGKAGTEQLSQGNRNRATARVAPPLIERQLKRFPWMLSLGIFFGGYL